MPTGRNIFIIVICISTLKKKIVREYLEFMFEFSHVCVLKSISSHTVLLLGLNPESTYPCQGMQINSWACATNPSAVTF
jgi:hypothetical protein